jgi:phage FluMu gp28-like protein
LIVSASEKNAQDVLDKVKRWHRIATDAGLTLKLTTDSKSEVAFEHGGQILSLAQNPRTVRGFAGNVYLDEAAHHRDDKAIYTAILPAISHGYRLSILSTPLGQSGLFFDVWSDPKTYPDYERHAVDINAAVRDGLPMDVDLLRRNLDDESWRQEYLCEFIDEASSYFPFTLLRQNIGEPGRDSGVCYLGADVGRKRDLTCIYVVRKLTDGHLEVIASDTMQGVPFAAQRERIVEMWKQHQVQRGCMDATGMGMQLAEEMSASHGMMESVTFTAEVKEKLATAMKRMFEARRITIPDDRDLINDIHSVRKLVTPSNNIRFDADRTEKGHADRFWALALAVHAADNGTEPGVYWL